MDTKIKGRTAHRGITICICRHTEPDKQSGVCGQWCNHWRQCPTKECGLDIAYCDAHGGTSRAEDEMIDHIKTNHQ